MWWGICVYMCVVWWLCMDVCDECMCMYVCSVYVWYMCMYVIMHMCVGELHVYVICLTYLPLVWSNMSCSTLYTPVIWPTSLQDFSCLRLPLLLTLGLQFCALYGLHGIQHWLYIFWQSELWSSQLMAGASLTKSLPQPTNILITV